MKQDISTMTVQQIERELRDFAWEYIALSDKAQTDEYYAHGAKLLDIRKEELEKELRNRQQKNLEPVKSMDCGNCGVIRFIHGGILEACPNCGDDETDLSIWDDVP